MELLFRPLNTKKQIAQLNFSVTPPIIEAKAAETNGAKGSGGNGRLVASIDGSYAWIFSNHILKGGVTVSSTSDGEIKSNDGSTVTETKGFQNLNVYISQQYLAEIFDLGYNLVHSSSYHDNSNLNTSLISINLFGGISLGRNNYIRLHYALPLDKHYSSAGGTDFEYSSSTFKFEILSRF